MVSKIEFPLASPESQGVRKEVIAKALRLLGDKQIPLHSFLVVRHGKLICEVYGRPFGRSTLHRLYSSTKSFVALGVGVLLQEGKINLDDSICDYFPEMLPSPVPDQIRRMTIRNMLMMESCHASTTYKFGSSFPRDSSTWHHDWVRSFFQEKPDHDPGSVFMYDTSAPHVLGALCEKLSGKSLSEFLLDAFLEGIGVSRQTYCLKDPVGVSIGGSGMMMRPLDVMRTLSFIAKGGMGVIPSSYLKEATSPLCDTSANYFDSSYGYGYYFWRTSHDGWSMQGLGGQLAIALPDKEMLFVTNADTIDIPGADQYLKDAIWNIAESAVDYPLKESEGSLEDVDLPSLVCALEPRTIQGSYCFPNNSIGIACLKCTIGKEEGRLEVQKEDGRQYAISFGIGHNIIHPFPSRPSISPVACSGGWMTDGTFRIWVQFLGENQGNWKAQLSFTEGRVTMLAKLTGELEFHGMSGVCSGEAK